VYGNDKDEPKKGPRATFDPRPKSLQAESTDNPFLVLGQLIEAQRFKKEEQMRKKQQQLEELQNQRRQNTGNSPANESNVQETAASVRSSRATSKRRRVQDAVPFCMWELLLQRCYSDYELDEDQVTNISAQCAKFITNYFEYVDNLPEDPHFQYSIPVPGTELQNSDTFWHRIRCVILTASNCKKIVCFKKMSAVKNYLRLNLWRLGQELHTSAIVYGRTHEGN